MINRAEKVPPGVAMSPRAAAVTERAREFRKYLGNGKTSPVFLYLASIRIRAGGETNQDGHRKTEKEAETGKFHPAQGADEGENDDSVQQKAVLPFVAKQKGSRLNEFGDEAADGPVEKNGY